MPRSSLFAPLLRHCTVAFGVALLASTMVLAGCGFQLRGLSSGSKLRIQQIDLSIAEDTPQNRLARDLRDRLLSAGVKESRQARYRLNVASVQINETNVGYNGSSDQERELALTLPYSLQRVSDGAYITTQEKIMTRGTYQTSDHQLLQRDDQRARVEATVIDEAAAQLVERLRTLNDVASAQ